MSCDIALTAIHDLYQAKAKYCRTLDTKHWEEFATVLAEDVSLDLSDGNPDIEPIVGRDNVIAAIRESVTGAKTVHQVHIPEITIAGDDAHAIWPVQERVVWDNGTSLTAFGHYHDRWVRTDGQWALAESKLSHLIMDFG
ncbi:nuclear transport factor 2 family protein [Mycolicibacterium gadium]|uniref:Nuclear transport factor 2 family protein n=1 Tax=Mycolicibacterium gadium TaxID=1794 RepID=A0ABT6GII4_MYCGU|nr:nuclear transport factor 2 family protein [Mycolicibacterium gadium]MDG5481208.1 nuclear transport factor 2 family protein [Mycolicibacterium gadium]